MELNGIPLHPLVVHAAVVFVPLACLAALVFAARSGWQRAVRWPLVVLGLVGAGVTQLAAMTGDDLKHARHLQSPLIETHEMWAGRMQLGMWVLAGVIVVAVLLTRRSSAGALALLARGLLVAGAVAVGYLTYRTGDAGAAAVWKVS